MASMVSFLLRVSLYWASRTSKYRLTVQLAGIDYRDFVLKVHSGDVWAKCVSVCQFINLNGC